MSLNDEYDLADREVEHHHSEDEETESIPLHDDSQLHFKDIVEYYKRDLSRTMEDKVAEIKSLLADGLANTKFALNSEIIYANDRIIDNQTALGNKQLAAIETRLDQLENRNNQRFEGSGYNFYKQILCMTIIIVVLFFWSTQGVLTQISDIANLSKGTCNCPSPKTQPNVLVFNSKQETCYGPQVLMHSPNGNCRLDFQEDGNLVIYCNNVVVWATGTDQYPVTAGRVCVSNKGKILLYSKERADVVVWGSQSSEIQCGGVRLELDNNGVLSITHNSDFYQKVVWSSG